MLTTLQSTVCREPFKGS